jgi:hypothetical protein
MRGLFLCLTLSLALSALTVAFAAPSHVIYPAQRMPLTFSHALHVGKLGAACVQCHTSAPTSRSAIDRLIPGEDACRACHVIDRALPAGTGEGPPTACVACHPGYQPGESVARVYIPPPSLKFSHQAHRTTECQRCHGDMSKVTGLATREHLPSMDSCLTCHDGVRAADACTTCHLATQGGRIRTDLPDGALVPIGGATGALHDLDFRTNHDQIARAEPQSCAGCHEKRFCADCHAGVIKPMDFHPGNYVALHAVEARRNVPDCSACHKSQRFCVGCHERSGVGARAQSGFDRAGTENRFHRPNWNHGIDAQKNIKACAGCHREDFCVECHTAEPARPGVSPHGPAWRGSSRCQALASKNQRLCLRCHIELSRVTCD